MARIIAIDDEKSILDIIQRGLEKNGHQVSVYTDVNQIQIENLKYFDLMILDVMMPNEDGFTFCEKIRSLVDFPILFLTAKVLEEDIIQGLAIGGDDYIMKPFRIAELRARVDAHLRRENREKSHFFHANDCYFDMDSKILYYKDQEISLTKSEYAICEYLARHKGHVFSKEQIYEAVFSLEGESDSSTISTHVKNIRNKMEVYGVSYIKTVWGIGYKWEKE